MKDNFELLKMAGKASGILLMYQTGDNDRDEAFVYNEQVKPGLVSVIKCNPLEDDGDALRLVVKLGFSLMVKTELNSENISYVEVIGDANHRIRARKQFVGRKDVNCAVRRAITMAAAQVGRQLP